MRFKRIVGAILCLAVVITSLCVITSAADIENEKTYKPLDLVVVLDSSGSMKESDKDRTALAAIRMLVNMMPAEGSRVGVVRFNKSATVLTKDERGNDALLSLESLTDVATIKKNVSDVVYDGGTGIGNAVFKATELLKSNKSSERAQAIILFTDGVNDFDKDALALSKCEENEASVLLWAKKSNCPIYCVDYDYIKPDGTNSMGKNGEGLEKLKNISSTTQGKFKSINNIKEIEQLLIEFLADVCDLNYTTVATIPGDGGEHECKIPVSPSVVEANIRIAGGNKNSIANGNVRLFDPDGNEIELRNSGNIRFDTDARAASIKVVMPKTGEWMLVVKGIKGDDIHVGLLEHFKMNLTSLITLPAGNPDGVAYNNDEVGIKTWLTYDGQDLDNEAIYDAVKSATAICVPRANPDNKKIINLQRDGLSFVGSFIIPEDCYYDITIRLDWDTVYREDTLEIQSSNKPLYIVSEIPEVKVNKNKTAVINNIYQYVADDENDKITASISSVGSADVADVSLNGNDLVFVGKKMSSSLVTITFTDEQGNTVDVTIKVKVNDPVVWIVLSLLILMGIAVAILLPYLSYQKSLKIRGKLYLSKIEISESEDDFDEPVEYDFIGDTSLRSIEAYPRAFYIPMDRYYKKIEKRNVAGLISETADLFRGYEADTMQYNAKNALLGKTAKELMSGAEKSKIIGTPTGASFKVKINKKTPYLTIARSAKEANVSTEKELVLSFKTKRDATSTRSKRYLNIHYYFVSNVREKKKSGKK